jgi:hypothetical protein
MRGSRSPDPCGLIRNTCRRTATISPDDVVAQGAAMMGGNVESHLHATRMSQLRNRPRTPRHNLLEFNTATN